eukprot:g28331.t1
MWLRATGKAVNAAVTVVSLEIRVASAGVSLGLRAADAGRSAALQVARRVVPGSDTAVVRFMLARAEAARSTTVILVGHCDRLLQGPVSLTTRLVRQVPLGPTALSVLGTMGRLGKGLVRTCFLMAAAVESPEARTANGLVSPFFVKLNLIQVIGSTSGDGMPLVQAGLPTTLLLQAAGGSELAELSGKAELVKLEAAARMGLLAELLTRAERLAEREVAEAREALQRRAKSACESMCRSTVAFTCDLAWRLPLAGQVLLDAFQRELEDLQEQKPARRSWLQTFEAYSRVMFSSACEAMPVALACCQSLNLKSSDSFAGADGTEPDHGNSAPLLPEVRLSGVAALSGAMRRFASPRQQPQNDEDGVRASSAEVPPVAQDQMRQRVRRNSNHIRSEPCSPPTGGLGLHTIRAATCRDLGRPPRPQGTPREEAKDDDVETGHEREAPGAAPWRIFRNMSLATCIFWILAGVWSFMTVAIPELIDLGLAFEDEIAEKHKPQSELVGLAPLHEPGSQGERRSSLLALRTSVKTAKFEPVHTTWPYPGIRPTGLSCDARGHHLLVTDGLSTFVAAVHEKAAPCTALLGERLQDTALTCFENTTASCEALVLHQQGRRVASCHVENGGGSSLSVSTAWLDGPQSADPEKALFVMMDPACFSSKSSDLLGPSCASVGTSKRRAARLQRGAKGDDRAQCQRDRRNSSNETAMWLKS